MPGLDDSVQFAKGVGPARLELLNRLGVRTIRDLLYFVPRDYEDRSHITPIKSLRVGDKATVRARVVAAEKYRGGRGRGMGRVEVADETGNLMCQWFDARFFRPETFAPGREFLITGAVTFFKGLQMVSPHCEPADEGEALPGPRILPIYPLTESLHQTGLRRVIKGVVDEHAPRLTDIFDAEFLKARELPALAQAVRTIHYPESLDQAARARRRLAYDELFILELAMALRRRAIRAEEAGISFQVTPEIDARIRRRFPFTLTGAQQRVISEIAADMQSPKAMNRLLQGDVGSGKTVVALYAMLVAVANKHQAAIMAPTEILAAQHYETLNRYLAGSRVRIELFSGGRPARERAEANARLAAGEIDIAVGTHALVEGDVDFRRLGLVVVDEQHKFGVLQRARLRRKGRHPDVLLMTATPIPRTLALTVFGDLDVSTLDELPPGRRPITSRWFPPEKLNSAYEFIRQHVTAGEQAFVVYPLVEDSEALDLKAATTSAMQLQREIFPEFRVGLLHGRMRPDEKDRVMIEFRAGRYHILVSTLVIEVGIDVPNSTIMVIEHAERYGLAQLHQLRGRIGRGNKPSFFLLFGEPKSDDSRKRLDVICSTGDGFKIAEEDLRMRGPGEFFGTRQHGLPELRFADVVNDFRLMQLARRDAFDMVAKDADLSNPAHAAIRARLAETFKDRMDLINVG